MFQSVITFSKYFFTNIEGNVNLNKPFLIILAPYFYVVPRLLPITHLPIGLLSSDFYPSHFYPSRLLPITGLSSKKDFYPSGHSPIRTFTHLFYFKHHKQRRIKRKLNPSLSLNKKLFFHRHLPGQCWVRIAKPCFSFP